MEGNGNTDNSGRKSRGGLELYSAKEGDTEIRGGGLRMYMMHSGIGKMPTRPGHKMETHNVEKYTRECMNNCQNDSDCEGKGNTIMV